MSRRVTIDHWDVNYPNTPSACPSRADRIAAVVLAATVYLPLRLYEVMLQFTVLVGEVAVELLVTMVVWSTQCFALLAEAAPVTAAAAVVSSSANTASSPSSGRKSTVRQSWTATSRRRALHQPRKSKKEVLFSEDFLFRKFDQNLPVVSLRSNKDNWELVNDSRYRTYFW